MLEPVKQGDRRERTMSKIWLIGTMAFVIALVVGGVTVALVTNRAGVELLPANSPEGVVQRYLQALEREDLREAYSYLSRDLQSTCSLDDFVREASWRRMRGDHVTLEDTQVLDGGALVRARVTVFDPGQPFGPSEYSYDRFFHLKLEEGQWRLVEPEWSCPRRLMRPAEVRTGFNP
jgi:hypothetical protein